MISRRRLLVGLPALAAAGSGGWTGLAGSAAAPPTPPFFTYLTGRLPPPALVAFNPRGFDPRQPPSPEPYPRSALLADLQLLRPAFDGLILYSLQPNLTPELLAAAIECGYRAVLLGIWDPRSPAEITGTAKLVAAHANRLALAVCIGNEGINENRYRIEDLVAAADSLRQKLPAGIDVPVTTSEPGGDYGWVPLRAFGGFLAPNLHPALDRAALDPDRAAAWVRGRARAIAAAAGRPVLVKETGMPNGGDGAQTPQRQAAFWRAYLAGGTLDRVSVPPVWLSFAAAFEAFDTPWKAAPPAMPTEAHWGLVGRDGTPYPAVAEWRRATAR